MGLVVKTGNRYQFHEFDGTYDSLPIGVYHLNQDQKGFFLERKRDFKLPSKLYGNYHEFVDRVIKHHSNKTKNTGVLLTGLKGTGKTITAEMLCIKMNKPVVLITNGYSEDDFKSFISNDMMKDVIIYIDEFEKVYKSEGEQNTFLQVMDGALSNSNHNLYIFTCNEVTISEYFINRLDRVMYHKAYKGLTDSEIMEVAVDLLDADKQDEFIKTVSELDFVTYDIAINVINEMKLHDEPASSVIKHMCLQEPEQAMYAVSEFYNGTEYKCRTLYCDYPLKEYLECYNNIERYDNSKRQITIDIKKYLSDRELDDNVPVNEEYEELNKFVKITEESFCLSRFPILLDNLQKVGKNYILHVTDNYYLVFKRQRKYTI